MQPSQLSVVGNPFNHLDAGALVDEVTRIFGVQHVDVSSLNLAGRDVHEFAATLAAGGVAAHTVSLAAKSGRVGVPGDRDRVRTLLLDAVQHAQVLDASYVQFHTTVGGITEPWTLVKRTAAELAPVIEVADDAGVTLVLENNFDQRDEDPLGINPARTPELLLALVEAVGPEQLKVTFDPCNAYMAGVEPYPYAYELLRDHVVGLHLKDARRFTPLLHGDPEAVGVLMTDSLHGDHLPVPVGHGAVGWDGLLRGLVADGFEGWLTFEPMPLREPMEEWARRSIDFVRARLTAGGPAVAAS